MVRLFCITQKRKGVAGAMIEAGIGLLGIERFYHVSRSASTPSSVFTGTPSHPLSHPGATRTSEQLKNGNSYTIKNGRRQGLPWPNRVACTEDGSVVQPKPALTAPSYSGVEAVRCQKLRRPCRSVNVRSSV